MVAQGVSRKIWLSIGFFAAGFTIATATGLWQGGRLETNVTEASKALFPAAQRLQSATAGFQRMVKLQRDAVMTEDQGPLDQAKAEADQIRESLKSAAALPGLSADQARMASSLETRFSALAERADQTYRSMAGGRGNVDASVQNSLASLAGDTSAVQADLEKLSTMMSTALRERLDSATAASAFQRQLSMWLFGVTTLLSIIVVNWTIRKSVIGPLSALTSGLARNADLLSGAARKIAAGSENLAASSSGQAASLEEAAAACEQVSAMAERNADSARQAQALMQEAGSKFTEVDRSQHQLVEAMEKIGVSGSKISKIIKVIDEIAFQTNILALNAAVEAARAGEAGAGFSVVASEVRTLAQRSAQAAQDTSGLIEESVAAASEGQDRLTAVSSVLAENRSIAEKVTGLIDQISLASREQASGMAEVANTVTRASNTTQQTARHAEESVSETRVLEEQSSGLRGMVGGLEQMIGA